VIYSNTAERSGIDRQRNSRRFSVTAAHLSPRVGRQQRWSTPPAAAAALRQPLPYTGTARGLPLLQIQTGGAHQSARDKPANPAQVSKTFPRFVAPGISWVPGSLMPF
jgi:hypothetical protein